MEIMITVLETAWEIKSLRPISVSHTFDTLFPTWTASEQ